MTTIFGNFRLKKLAFLLKTSHFICTISPINYVAAFRVKNANFFPPEIFKKSWLWSQVSSVTKDSDGNLTVSTKEGATLEKVDCVLWAIGRTSNTEDLGLDSAGNRSGANPTVSEFTIVMPAL
jgi:hypothetical protein